MTYLIYDVLKDDHAKQRDLCAQLKETEGASEERKTLWEALRVELEAHAAAEEQAFYAEMMEQPKATDQSRHSVHEHQKMSKLTKELEKMDMSSSGWLTKFKTLADEVIHHLDEEETKVFKMAKSIFDEGKEKQMAEVFETRKRAEVKKVK